MFKGDAANKDMFNFSYVLCWICQWYQHVCVCIGPSESGTLLSLLSAVFLLSECHWSKGQPPRAVCACAVQSSLTQGQDPRPLLYLTPILGSFQPPDPGSSATALLILAPWLCCWGSLASAWLWEHWTQLQKTICFLRSFLFMSFFNNLISIKFNSLVSLVRVLGGNTVLQSEYCLLNLGKFYMFSLVSPLPLPEPAPQIYCPAALQVFIILTTFLLVLLDIPEY